MTQLRIAFSNGKPVTVRSQKRSRPPSVVLQASEALWWKLELLCERRPAVIAVIERLVDDLLDELDNNRP